MTISLFKTKSIWFASFFILVVALLAFLVYELVSGWSSEVVQTNKVLTEVIVQQISNSAEKKIERLYRAGYFSVQTTESSFTKNDRELSQITSSVLENVKGMEGGFYFINFSKFQGYAYPTSPPPVPVYGPPPRSYNIIENQIKECIRLKNIITELHEFDPAIFPLSTTPIIVEGNVIGAAWVRIHIEKELPDIKLQSIINIAGFIALSGFLIALFFTIRQKRTIDELKEGLTKLETDQGFRFKKMPGIFGYISDSINTMIDSLSEEHNKRTLLEKELSHQDKMIALGKLVAGVVHDVKTPLAIIKTRVQMWQRELSKEPMNINSGINEDSMELVTKEIDRLTALMNKLLAFSKPNNYTFVNAEINLIIKDVVALFHSDIRKKYSFDLNLNKNLTIKINPASIKQVFFNIITNAMEAMPDGGNISISSFREGKDKAVIKIADSGPGIKEEIADHIFDPFFTTKNLGTGLGLSMANEIVKAHKGTINFISSPQDGTTFIITLPIN